MSENNVAPAICDGIPSLVANEDIVIAKINYRTRTVANHNASTGIGQAITIISLSGVYAN